MSRKIARIFNDSESLVSVNRSGLAVPCRVAPTGDDFRVRRASGGGFARTSGRDGETKANLIEPGGANLLGGRGVDHFCGIDDAVEVFGTHVAELERGVSQGEVVLHGVVGNFGGFVVADHR